MKAVLLMCGLPGSGKSTWIRENGLEPYSISRDNLKLLYYGPTFDKYGRKSIPQPSEKFIQQEYLKIIEMRMRCNSFIILDNTHVKLTGINIIKQLAEYYGYRVFIKYMRSILPECLERNRKRDEIDLVPDYSISKLAGDLKILEPLSNPSVKDMILPQGKELEALSNYEKNDSFLGRIEGTIYVIGDIHGCYFELEKFLNSEVYPYSSKKNITLIFSGDYIDRGPDNLKVVRELIKISDNKEINSYFLEGNHEKHLRSYAYSREIVGKQFREVTSLQLDEDSSLKMDIRPLLMSMKTHVVFSSGTRTLFVCHGGVSWYNHVMDNTVYLNPESVIKGSEYPNGKVSEVSEIFEDSCPNDVIQIHGHREFSDKSNSSVHRVNTSVINLEGHVEMGGYLVVAKIDNGNIDILKY